MPQLSFLNAPHFDFGAIASINEVLRTLGVRRPLICTDPGLVQIALVDKLREQLSNEYGWELYAETPENPTEEAIEAALEQYQQGNCDSLICFGGGSSIDLGKVVSLLAEQGGKPSDYSVQAGGEIRKTVPFVAIPTTAGTGSEVSNGAVVIMRDGNKLILASPALVPDAAICDPELTLGLPPVLTAGAGMDAVTHCIEAILAPSINPPAEAVGLDGLERAIGSKSLLNAVKDGSDREARWQMMMAATEGAMAFTKGLGVVHAMSHACGSIKALKLHHGTLNGVILPTVLRFNKGAVTEGKYERIARAMGLAENTDLADHIESLNRDIGLPANLSEMGVTQDRFDYLIQHSQRDVCHMIAPKQPSYDEYQKLFAQAAGLA
ncbi:MAG: iron-containing alcohol dehydrogenase [Gammaproteobacteria bacterium]